MPSLYSNLEALLEPSAHMPSTLLESMRPKAKTCMQPNKTFGVRQPGPHVNCSEIHPKCLSWLCMRSAPCAAAYCTYLQSTPPSASTFPKEAAHKWPRGQN